MATMEQKAPGIRTGGKPKTYKNFIGGEWVESRTGRTFENLNPADTREVVGVFQKSDKAGRQPGHRGRQAGLQEVASGARAAARRDALQGVGDSDRAQGRVRAADDARDGQGDQGDARRRAGSHRLRLLHCRRRPPPVWSDRAVGAAQQIRHGDSPAAGRLRHDHAVEFSHGDSVVEAVSRARCRQYCGDQAGAGHAALDVELRAGAGRWRSSGGRSQHRYRLRRRSRHADGRASRGARGFADRIDRGWPHRGTGSGQDLQALLAGVGRQESHDRARRRQPWSWRWKARCGARSALPDSAAPRPAASSCRRACTRSLSTRWWRARRS